MNNNIKNFFYPESICLVGASSKKGNIGYEITRSIIEYGFKGKLYLINPKGEEVLGYKCHTDISEIPDQADLAVIVVGKQFVEQSIDLLLQKGIKSIILITAGFKETGKEGEEIENRILSKIKTSGARLIGPNCMGVINALEGSKLNITFVAEEPQSEGLAFLSQSGALGAAVLNSLRETGIKFGHFVSVGNKADINENDLIEYWEDDENISAVAMYLESFSDGKKFIKILLNNKKSKPLIILKAGKTKSGMKAASSHTGALGSSDKVIDSVLNQFGVLRVNDLSEMFNTSKMLLNFPSPKGRKGVVITNAGGPAILAVDKLEECGLELTNLSEEIKAKLKDIVHPEGSVNNPIDLLPNGDAAAYKKVVEVINDSDDVDFIVSIFVEPVMVKPFDVVEEVNSISSSKPILQVVMPLPEFWDFYNKNSKYGKPVFRNPEDPAIVLRNSIKQHTHRSYSRMKKLSKGDYNLKTSEGKEELYKKYNLPLVISPRVNKEDLKYQKLHYPVVLKAYSLEDLHKSDLGGVKLNIKNNDELINAAEEMINNFGRHNIELNEFLIQPFIQTRFELLVGGFNDQDFGPMIMFGSGGKYVEYIEDVCLKSAYLNDEDLEELISSTKIGKLLKGVRGEEAIDISELKKIIKNVAQMLIDNDDIKEFEINPLTVSINNKFYAIDLRIK